MTDGHLVVAIDGPAGAGKSTVTRRVASELEYVLLDTGALYRCVALEARRREVDWGDEVAVGGVARALEAAESIRFAGSPSAQRVLLNGEDVTAAIREQDIGQGASRVSALPEVRASLLQLQRGFGRRGPLVAEGRDIGTVVFPDAKAKFYLTASAEARAERRHQELLGRGESVSFESVLREVVERDRRDTNRAIAPLTQAVEAVVVDSTSLSIDQVVDSIISRVRSLAALTTE